nr:hypothetical protein [Tanacetum cinerariifolium]
MVKMVPYEGFACPCGAGDVVLRESYKPKTRGKLYYACPQSKHLEDTIGCKFFLWKEERVRLLVGSLRASTTLVYSPGSSSTSIYSPGSLTHPRYFPGASTPQSYSMGTSKKGEYSNCKHLLDKITILEATGSNTCSFYMRNGICGYGVACKYDHPEPVNQYPLQGYGSYAADELEEHQNEPDGNGYRWNGDANQYVQWPEPNFYYPSAESREYENGYHRVTNDRNANGNQYHQHPNAGWNENQHKMKEPVTLSDVGLPLRPGKKVCLYYESLGLCKYGHRCKFDHPVAFSSNDEGFTKPVSGSNHCVLEE